IVLDNVLNVSSFRIQQELVLNTLTALSVENSITSSTALHLPIFVCCAMVNISGGFPHRR
ncbi:hypothetical protein AVEN_143433-1, partial [Araneus ventricosus]